MNPTSSASEISYAYVLMHGFASIQVLSKSWDDVKDVLYEERRVQNSDILTLQMPLFGSIEDKTKSAISDISAKFPGRTVHLIAHSLGGLIARDIAARSGTEELKFTVLTVTTFGTPHFGVKALESTHLANRFVKVVGSVAPALVEMKPSVVAQFHEMTRVNPDVKYFTLAGQCAFPKPLFALTWPLTRRHGPTDSVINVSSAQWDPQYCTQLGVIKGADHSAIHGKGAMQLAIPHLRAAEKGEKAPVEKFKNTHQSSPFLSVTSSEPIKFDEQGRLDGQYAQDTFHDFAHLDVGGGGSIGSGDVKLKFEPPLMYTPPSVPSYPQQKPTIATSTSPVIELIRETLYAALAKVFESTPSLIPLLQSNPSRAYFDAVALAVFDVSTSPSFLAASSSDNDVVLGVRGIPITLSDCPPYLLPLMCEFIAIGCDAANIQDEDDMESIRLVQEGRKGEEDVPRLKRARLLLEQGAGYDVGSADGRVVAFVDQVNTLASHITQLPQFKERQDKVFEVLGGAGLSS